MMAGAGGMWNDECEMMNWQIQTRLEDLRPFTIQNSIFNI
jgi:hypothetical protein